MSGMKMSSGYVDCLMSVLCFHLVVVMLTADLAAAGCKKRRATNVLPEEWSLNTHLGPLSSPQLSLEELPKNFSWLDVNGVNMLVPSWNQHIPRYCGSCFLHGTLSMVQDRLKIAKKGAGPDVMLARQSFLNCAPFHDLSGGCDGGDVIDVLRYMAKYGLPDESCMPYSATDHTKYGKHAKKCPSSGYCTNCMPIDDVDTCWPVKTPMRYYVDAYGTVPEKGQVAMMNEILSGGPITCSMATPDVFDYGYHQGIAMDPFHNATEVDHDVEVVGWGETDQGLAYWVIRNSWGTYWGRLGFFLLERGTNALQIESGDCWWSKPTWADEADVRSGKKVGTMWGVMTPEEAARVLPEPGKKPHEVDPEREEARGVGEDEAFDVEVLGQRDPWRETGNTVTEA